MYAIPTYFLYFYPFYCISSYFSIPYALIELILCKRGYEFLFFLFFLPYYLLRMVIYIISCVLLWGWWSIYLFLWQSYSYYTQKYRICQVKNALFLIFFYFLLDKSYLYMYNRYI